MQTNLIVISGHKNIGYGSIAAPQPLQDVAEGD